MSRRPASRRRPLAAGMTVVALAVAACDGEARAADDRVADAANEPQPAETVRFAPAGNVQVMGQGFPAEYDLGLLFDQQVFGRPRAAHVIVLNNEVVIRKTASAAEESVLEKLGELRRRGEARIARLDQVCGLGAQQRKLLGLALASDLRRVAGEIDAVRRSYVGQRIARQRLPVEQQRLQAMHQDAVRCRGLIDRAFHEGSLVAAVGIGVLEPNQRRRVADWVSGRRATRWEAMVRLVLDQLDESVLGLSGRQHQALLDRLLGDVPPLAVFDDERVASRGHDPTSFTGMLVLARLGRAGEQAVRPLLDQRQWAELERRIVQAGQPEAVERMLVEQGILDAAGDEALAGEEVP